MFAEPSSALSVSYRQPLHAPVDRGFLQPSFDPSLTYKGTLPNGQGFTWGPLNHKAIPHILDLQERVNDGATPEKKAFLIERTADDYKLSMSGKLQHTYYGAWTHGKLVSVFGIAPNDDEVGDGRGRKTPLNALSVKRYKQVMILKGAQIDPDYEGMGLAGLAALTRYAEFLHNDNAVVLMTKVSEKNHKVVQNYKDNQFDIVYSTPVIDRGQEFDVLTLATKRPVIQSWVDHNGSKIMKKFNLKACSAAGKPALY